MTMKRLQILGSGCAKCQMLADHAERAALDLGIEYTLEKVTDFAEIARFGVMVTPALVVDGVVKVSGRVPTPGHLKTLIE
jgi:small redox-active disulfide protein 2